MLPSLFVGNYLPPSLSTITNASCYFFRSCTTPCSVTFADAAHAVGTRLSHSRYSGDTVSVL